MNPFKISEIIFTFIVPIQKSIILYGQCDVFL